MTYSIVARDAETGQLGVAVQTGLPFVGNYCPWVLPGVGAVCTQAMTRVAHGDSMLRLLQNGHTAPEALAAVLAGDAGAAIRQIGVVDAKGNAAAHTGADTIRFAGHKTAEGVAVQANMMAQATVPDAMLAAYQSAEGSLAERIIAAMRAAQAEGGDFRGQQSAALKIVSGEQDNIWEALRYDLRVDDHPRPIEELARLATLQRANLRFDAAFTALGAGDFGAAQALYDDAVTIAPDDRQSRFFFAYEAALNLGELDAVREIFREAFAADAMWLECLIRVAEARPPKHADLIDSVKALA